VKPRQPKTNNELGRAAVRAFAANERMNQLLLKELDPAAWTARPPGRVRTVAQIFAHMHNVRTKWIRLTAPHLKLPRQLARAHGTPAEARAALAASASRCSEMLTEAFGSSGRVARFLRDGWAKPWPVGPNGSGGIEMLAYMLTHEAHHRGQVCLLAHQLGCKLPGRVTSALWSWERSWTGEKPSSRLAEHEKSGSALD
jgi:uncharacterized damage-inducible protein DinB